jgi:biopolymer transport protein ExbD
MKQSRRIKRMERRRKGKTPGLNLVSLMDVFTILLVFLLVNSAASQTVKAPDKIKLPDSIVESKPRETVVIMVAEDQVLVQGDPVAATPELLQSKESTVPAITQTLKDLQNRVIGINTQAAVESKEVTILAHKSIPFKVLKKIMSSCTSAGYGKISLAVIQKAAGKPAKS